MPRVPAHKLRDPAPPRPRTLLDLPKVRELVERMVLDGETVKTAALALGLRVRRARRLFTDPDVVKYYQKLMQDLRANEGARNIHAAIAIRDAAFKPEATAAERKVALDAARYLDGDTGGSGGTTVNVNVTPGYVIDLSGAAEPPRVIEHHAPMRRNPLADIEDVGE